MLGVKTPKTSKLPPSMVLLMIQFTLRLVGSFSRYLQWELGTSQVIVWDFWTLNTIIALKMHRSYTQG